MAHPLNKPQENPYADHDAIHDRENKIPVVELDCTPGGILNFCTPRPGREYRGAKRQTGVFAEADDPTAANVVMAERASSPKRERSDSHHQGCTIA